MAPIYIVEEVSGRWVC